MCPVGTLPDGMAKQFPFAVDWTNLSLGRGEKGMKWHGQMIRHFLFTGPMAHVGIFAPFQTHHSSQGQLTAEGPLAPLSGGSDDSHVGKRNGSW